MTWHLTGCGPRSSAQVALLIGGAGGGWFVLRAGRQQFERDREANRLDRSHQAAITILKEADRMHGAVRTWARNQDTEAVEGAFDAFAEAVSIQLVTLIDNTAGDCWLDYLALVAEILESTHDERIDPKLVEAERRQYSTLLTTIGYHVEGRTPPTYEPPPLGDLTALRNWGNEVVPKSSN